MSADKFRPISVTKTIEMGRDLSSDKLLVNILLKWFISEEVGDSRRLVSEPGQKGSREQTYVNVVPFYFNLMSAEGLAEYCGSLGCSSVVTYLCVQYHV